MNLCVVRVGSGLGRPLLQPADLGTDPRPLLLAAKAESGPVVLVLRQDDLSRLADCAELIDDRGRKHPARPLHRILLGRKRSALVRAEYVVPGRLLGAMQELLARARKQGDENLFLIAVPALLFSRLLERAEVSRPVESASLAAQPDEAGGGDTHPLIALLPPLPIPERVARCFLGDSPRAAQVRQSIVRVARHHQPVLLLGETGTGKDVAAGLIHSESGRRGAFVVVDCSAIARELLEAELFGSVRGAFTDAKVTRDGLWQAAEGGTLFLDELGELSLDHQAKLLRAIESGEIRRVGSTQPQKLDVRIVAATNRDLGAMVRVGTFRLDLYHRLDHAVIRMPPLREHRASIATLARRFWRRLARPDEAELREEVLSELARYPWPGNIRQLLSVLDTLYTQVGPAELGVKHVRALLGEEATAGLGVPDSAPSALAELILHRAKCVRHLLRADQIMRAAQLPLRQVMSGAPVTEEVRRVITQSTAARVEELEALCATPALFHGEPFDLVRRVKNELRTFRERLQTDPADALAYWKRVLDPDFALAFRAIVRAIDELTQHLERLEGWPRRFSSRSADSAVVLSAPGQSLRPPSPSQRMPERSRPPRRPTPDPAGS